MEAACAVKDRIGDFIGREPHVRTGIAEETEILVAVIPDADKDDGGARMRIDQEMGGVDAGIVERLAQKLTERVVADLAHERGCESQTLEADGHVGRRAARGFDETGRIAQRDVLLGRYKIDEQFAHADDIGHDDLLDCVATCRMKIGWIRPVQYIVIRLQRCAKEMSGG